MSKSDPARFAQELRGKQAGAAETITPGEWEEHYSELLDGVNEDAGEAHSQPTAMVGYDTPASDAADKREEVQQARERLQQPFSEAGSRTASQTRKVGARRAEASHA